MVKNWIELRDKTNKSLIRIVYNPYNKKPKEIIRNWILPKHYKEVIAIKTK